MAILCIDFRTATNADVETGGTKTDGNPVRRRTVGAAESMNACARRNGWHKEKQGNRAGNAWR
ncbi:hypothetical protein GCM10007171_17080 [Dickeya fangzhongdai]|nr:hypothetical protein GCM10007171_17080 [Dickeya fangzhongdai]